MKTELKEDQSYFRNQEYESNIMFRDETCKKIAGNLGDCWKHDGDDDQKQLRGRGPTSQLTTPGRPRLVHKIFYSIDWKMCLKVGFHDVSSINGPIELKSD